MLKFGQVYNQVVVPFKSSDFTWDGQEDRTFINENRPAGNSDTTTVIKVPANDNVNLGGLFKLKTGPYTITTLLSINSASDLAFGLAAVDSVSGKMVLLAYSWDNGLRVIKQNSKSSYNSDYTNGSLLNNQFRYVKSALTWLQIQDDGTNYIFSISNNGYDFITVLTVSRTDFLVADSIGIYTVSDGNADCYVSILSWKEE